MEDLKWWQKAVFYQIYPRSFADGDGDGIGDFPGMIDRLDYLRSLGIGAIWLSPHYPSPFIDCGYDIADYTAVAPEYGTLQDFIRFLDGAHQRGMRVILDLVLNHTSDQHPWFLESKSSRYNAKADWYLWADKPPNNWQSCFDGQAWTYLPERGQYYYHYFMKQQPDLNWHNPVVKQAIWDAVRFWLDLGVDGYRLDAIGTIYEHPELPDHPVPMNMAQLRRASELAKTLAERERVDKYWQDMFMYQLGQPGLHGLMKELRTVIDEYDGDRVLVAEDDDVRYMGDGEDELHLVFNFPLMRSECLTADSIRQNQRERLAVLAEVSPGAWPCNTLGNHDSSRLVTRYADGTHDADRARLSVALMLTLRGTPFLYNGEEIGMTDLHLTDINDFRDTMGTWYYHTAVDDLGVDPVDALRNAALMTRDKNRTPMQWANVPNGGFCPSGVGPWLPVHPNYAQGVNVAEQDSDPGSLLNYYRRLLYLRNETPALVAGEYLPLHEDSADYLAFLRCRYEQTCLVVLNMSGSALMLSFDIRAKAIRLLFSSREREGEKVTLSQFVVDPFEVIIAEIIEPDWA